MEKTSAVFLYFLFLLKEKGNKAYFYDCTFWYFEVTIEEKMQKIKINLEGLRE